MKCNVTNIQRGEDGVFNIEFKLHEGHSTMKEHGTYIFTFPIWANASLQGNRAGANLT